MSKQRVLFWVYLDSHFREMIRVARLVKARTRFEPFFLFEYHYPRLPEDVALCVAENIEFMDAPAPVLDAAAPGPRRDGYWEKLKGVVQTPDRTSRGPDILRMGIDLLRKAYHGTRRLCQSRHLLLLRRLRYYGSILTRAQRILDDLDPVLVIVPEDNVEYNIPSFVKEARRRRIPSIVIPYTIANAREPAEAYWQNTNHQVRGICRRGVARLFPQWEYTHRGRRLFRLPADHILAQQWFRLAAPLPWILNSGHADVIAVESEAVRQYYLRAGLPAAKLRAVGSLRQDELLRFQKQARAHRERLLSRLGRRDDRALIVCALPPDQRPANRPGCEFSSYQDLLVFWAKTLGSIPDCHVIVNPHPRIPSQEIDHLERWGIHIVRDDIAQLIPLCDVFVASISATISMALACGKPVVNYDVYRYRYDDFEGVPEVHTFETRAEFATALKQALARADGINTLGFGRGPADGYWGTLDGHAGDRLITLIDELTGGMETRAAA